jgi:AbrB family looped-hinge helix DNA binding protein
MENKTVVSSRGQVVIPKLIRDTLGIHSGSELFISVRKDHVLELTPVHRDISAFFGKGSARVIGEKMSLEDIDVAIARAVTEENKKKK